MTITLFCSGLPKVTFWAVAEAVAVDGKTSATEAVAEAVAEGLDFNKSLVDYINDFEIKNTVNV